MTGKERVTQSGKGTSVLTLILSYPQNRDAKDWAAGNGRLSCYYYYCYYCVTMCDFHDFGLTFFLHNVFFVVLKMSKNAFCVVARLPQRLKSTFFEKFSSLRWPLQGLSVQIFFKKR